MDAVNYNAKIFPFSIRKRPQINSVGWVRHCFICGQQYILSYQACTIRDGREKICTSCFLEVWQ